MGGRDDGDSSPATIFPDDLPPVLFVDISADSFNARETVVNFRVLWTSTGWSLRENHDDNGRLLQGQDTHKKDGDQHLADTVLSDKKVICLYFAAQWCPPCRMFTPFLANAYKDAKKENLSIEVIFISQDGNRNDMMAHMQFSHGDWYALRFADRFQR
ncbi:nucleoredoxin-like protein 2 [Haemaphysalis longicornis]